MADPVVSLQQTIAMDLKEYYGYILSYLIDV